MSQSTPKDSKCDPWLLVSAFVNVNKRRKSQQPGVVARGRWWAGCVCSGSLTLQRSSHTLCSAAECVCDIVVSGASRCHHVPIIAALFITQSSHLPERDLAGVL